MLQLIKTLAGIMTLGEVWLGRHSQELEFQTGIPEIGDTGCNTVRNSHRVTYLPTLGKYSAHLIFTWKKSILTDLTYRYVLECVSSRI